LKLQRALSTQGLEQELSADLGRYPGGMEETVAEDEIRARFAIRLLEKKHPGFFTVYLTGLDTEEHLSGPFSPKSNETLERLDAIVGSLRAAAEKAAPGRATICVVSDHGFAAVEHDVNLYAAFRDAGLFTVDKDNAITGWKAMLWPAGGQRRRDACRSGRSGSARPRESAARQTGGAIPPTASSASGRRRKFSAAEASPRPLT